MYCKEIELLDFYFNPKNKNKMTQIVTQSEIGRRNVNAIGKLLTRQNNSQIYDDAIEQVYKAKMLLTSIAQKNPKLKIHLTATIDIESVRILSDLSHDLGIMVKETTDGCFVSEMNVEAGKIILRCK